MGKNDIKISEEMQTQDVRVTVRVNRELKESADALFDYLGLNMSNAVNIFLRKAVEHKGIPFPVNVANKGASGIKAEEVTLNFVKAVEQDIAKKQEKKLPIAQYDIASKRAYLENADGTREYI
jgi:DNA-damage-inducible protein J